MLANDRSVPRHEVNTRFPAFRTVSLAALVFCFAAVVLPSSSAQTTDSWPMFRLNPEHTGFQAGGAGTTWMFGTTAGVESSPALVDGVVYVGSNDGSLYAVDAETGSQSWSFATPGGRPSSPAVVDGLVFFGSSNHRVYAVDASTGIAAWDYLTGDDVRSSPAVVGGILYVGSDDGNVYALMADSGVLLWKFATGYVVDSSPVVVGGVVYVGSVAYVPPYDGRIFALDAYSGELKWKYSMGASPRSSPAVANGIVYIGTNNGELTAVDSASGTLRWRFFMGTWQVTTPTVVGGVVYFGSGDYGPGTGPGPGGAMDHTVFAVNASSGLLKWQHRTGAAVLSSPAVAGGSAGFLYIGSNDNKVYALNAATGAEQWHYVTGGSVTSSPATANGVVYIGSNDNKLYALDQQTGTAAPPASPVAANALTVTVSSLPAAIPPGSSFSVQVTFSGSEEIFSDHLGAHFGPISTANPSNAAYPSTCTHQAGTSPATVQVQCTAPTQPGTYYLRGHGRTIESGTTFNWWSDEHSFTVAAGSGVAQANGPLGACFASSTPDSSGLTANVNAACSTGTIVAWTWDWGDGTHSSGMTASHTYSLGGMKMITLTVTDGTGNQTSIVQPHGLAQDTPAPTGAVSIPRAVWLAIPVLAIVVAGAWFGGARTRRNPALTPELITALRSIAKEARQNPATPVVEAPSANAARSIPSPAPRTAGARLLKCPHCGTEVPAPAGAKVVCPQCGFGASQK